MKNVLVFTLGGERYAVELRWVREVFTLAAMTPVPSAPAVVAGVVNHKGAIVPVLHGPNLLQAISRPGARNARGPRTGDALVLLDVEDLRAAIAVDRIDTVTTLIESPDGQTVDAAGQNVPLVDPPLLMSVAQKLVVGEHGPRP